MPWQSLGVLSPGLEWQSYPTEVIGSTTLRIIQTWGNPRPVGAALIAQQFPTPGGIARIVKVWAIDDRPRIINFPIPLDFTSQGLTTYTAQLKLGRFPHMGLESWQIEVQAFYP